MSTIIAPSDKQVALLTRLLDEREVTYTLAEIATMDRRQASAAITAALAAPKIAREVEVAPRPVGDLPEPGYYVSRPSGDFFVIVKSKNTGRVYAKKLVVSERNGRKTGAWVYAPGARNEFRGCDPLTIQTAAEFGYAHGFCFKCCRPLTDPESVRRGMGPVCARSLR